MRADLEALVEKLTASADEYDEFERLAETESDRRFYAGAASARWEDVELLSAILSRETISGSPSEGGVGDPEATTPPPSHSREKEPVTPEVYMLRKPDGYIWFDEGACVWGDKASADEACDLQNDSQDEDFWTVVPLFSAPTPAVTVGRSESCTIAPSAMNSVAQPATGTISDTGTPTANTWRTVIVGLPIIRKLLNGEDVTLETFKVNLIPDDVLWNGAKRSREKESHCIGYPDCDGDLEGEPHSDKCPMSSLAGERGESKTSQVAPPVSREKEPPE